VRHGALSTVIPMGKKARTEVDRSPAATSGFDSATLTGLLDVGVPQKFLRMFMAMYTDTDQWRAAAPLPGEDPLWRNAPPRDPECRTLVLGRDEYPWILSALSAPPALLYVEGALAHGSSPPGAMVCISGSRSMSALGRNVVDVVVEELAALGAVLVCGTEDGVEEYAARRALSANVPTVLIPSAGSRAASERVTSLREDVLAAGGSILSPFAQNVETNSFTLQASSRLLAMFAYPLIVAEANVPSATTALAAQALRVRSPLLVPLPRRGFRDARGARGLLALADVEHTRLLGWEDELLGCRGVNGFANAVAETGADLRSMLRVLWWLRPRSAIEVVRRVPRTDHPAGVPG
jgi:hypothetical protein